MSFELRDFFCALRKEMFILIMNFDMENLYENNKIEKETEITTDTPRIYKILKNVS